MRSLHHSTFFDLAQFPHASLFENCDFVWQALSRISNYLANYPLGKISCDIPKGAFLVNPEKIAIGSGTIIEPGAYIKGPCIIGENCVVRHGAYIRGDLIAGNQCVIGHDTEVKMSIFLNGAQAAHFAYVGDSILGNRVNLGAGTKCANLRFDHGNIEITVNKERFKTGLRKLGAIFGDDSQTGCNAVTNPGTLFGKNACCYPCTNVNGMIEADHIAKPSHTIVTRRLPKR